MTDTTGNPERRGGARPNSGPKPRRRPEYSEQAKRRLWLAISKVAREEGRDPFEVLARTAIHIRGKVATAQAANAMALILKTLTAGESHVKQDVSVSKNEGPGIFLPEQRPDPGKDAKVVELKAQK
jgi:hypothetical protein